MRSRTIVLIIWLYAATITGHGQEPMTVPGDQLLLQSLIDRSRAIIPVAQRIEFISERLLGRRYLTRPLIGSSMAEERLVTRLDGFDCVTFIETVLALTYAQSPEDFTQRLAAIRYQDARIDWKSRLHYATQWSAYQIARGLLYDLTIGEETLLRSKTLYQVSGLDQRQVEFRYYPKRTFARVAPGLQSGDIVFFVSGTAGLDTNHTGFVIRRGDQLLLRSASRRQRSVTDQPLDDYIRRHPMSGLFINRPR